jgi:hypothetical protein
MLIRDYFADEKIAEKEKKDARPIGAFNETVLIKELFQARKKYQNESLKYIDQNTGLVPYSDLYRNHALYGLLDLEGDIIIPKSIETNFSTVDNDFLLQNFCVEAYNDLKKYINDAVLCGKMSSESPYANIEIKKAFKDLNEIQRKNLFFLTNAFRLSIIPNKKENSEITNIDIFIKKYINFLYKESLVLPVTKSQTVLFYNFTFFFSGLTFSIAKDEAGNDLKKFDKYLTDPDFGTFAEFCMRFGFKIDKNIPWVLTVDLNSPAHYGVNGNHEGYITRNEINSINDLFKTRYVKAYKNELLELKNHFYDAYQLFLSKGNVYYRESDAKLCSKDVINSPNIYVRENLERSKFFEKYPDKFWLRVYAFLRNQETRKGLTQVQFENIVREAGEYASVGKTNEAMKYLNGYFKEYKELNYIFSLQEENPLLQQDVTNAGMPVLNF